MELIDVLREACPASRFVASGRRGIRGRLDAQDAPAFGALALPADWTAQIGPGPCEVRLEREARRRGARPRGPVATSSLNLALTPEERAQVETLRAQLGAASLAEAIRIAIRQAIRDQNS